MLKRWLFLGASLGLLWACSPNYAKIMSKEKGLDMHFSWEANPCLGSCAVYKASLNGDSLHFEGTRNTGFLGDTTISMGNFTFSDSVRAKLIRIKFFELDSLYSLGAATYDGPSHFYQADFVKPSRNKIWCKKVKTIGNAPAGLHEFQKWLDQQLADMRLL